MQKITSREVLLVTSKTEVVLHYNHYNQYCDNTCLSLSLCMGVGQMYGQNFLQLDEESESLLFLVYPHQRFQQHHPKSSIIQNNKAFEFEVVSLKRNIQAIVLFKHKQLNKPAVQKDNRTSLKTIL